MQPKVSVIVPIYKVEQYLDRCMNALFSQTLRELEIILVDDGSPDSCGAMCDEYAAQDSRIRVIHKKNGGLGFARNSGLELATGEYIAFLDSDDYCAADMYEKMYAAAKAHDADLVLAGVNTVGGVMFEKDLDLVGRKHCFSETEVFEGKAGIRKLTLGIIGAPVEEYEDSRYGFAVWKNLYRASTILSNQVRFRSEREIISEDVVFLMDLMPHVKKAVGIPGAYSYYCRNGASLSKRYKPERFARNKQLNDHLGRQLERMMPRAQFQQSLDRQLQSYSRVAAIQEIQHNRSSGLPIGELRTRLKAMCSDPKLSAALKRYPWHRLPITQAAFAFGMRFRLPGLLMLLVAAKEKCEKRKVWQICCFL